jgi:hypothetical protein
MPSEDQPQAHTPFDEQAAQEHLDRLKRELDDSRQRRKDASAAFDKFVSSFRKAPGDEAGPPQSRTESRNLSRRFDDPVFPAAPPTARRRPMPRIVLIAGGVLAVATGAILTRAWRGSPEQLSAPAAVETPAAEPANSPRGADVPSDSASAAPAELIAVRDVWVRATVDGQRVVERELEAGARVPLRGRTIVIRAGNAGAVRMVIDGQDRGTVGAEGVVLTRTYTTSAVQ